MHIFHIPSLQADELTLSEEESKHAIRVLRLREQDIVYLTDGVGGFCHARIIEANPKGCRVFVYHRFKEYGRRTYRLTIAIAPTKNIDRFEWFLEKSTEIGVDRIIPVICQQSERRHLKSERLLKIITESIKQSQQAYLPILENSCTFDQLMSRSFESKKLIAYCSDENRAYVRDTILPGQDVLVVIGPEGDFSPAEIQRALSRGYLGISLGNNRLRTETAGVWVCSAIAFVNQ
jgi:16S rRNA (uracil1498-N3)-methyltransferase